MPVVQACARHGEHVQVLKPIAVDLPTARKMIEAARAGGIRLGVVSGPLGERRKRRQLQSQRSDHGRKLSHAAGLLVELEWSI